MPVPARVLAVDPGKSSGWCLLEPGNGWSQPRFTATVGACDVWSTAITEVVGRASGMQAFVVEVPGGNASGRFLNMIAGLYGAIGAWRWAWRVHGPAKAELDVAQVSWRAALLGGTSSDRTTEEWKAASIEHAKSLELAANVIRVQRSEEWNAEMADALGLAWWAVHSPRLVDELGPAWCKRAGWDDGAACEFAVRAQEREAALEPLEPDLSTIF